MYVRFGRGAQGADSELVSRTMFNEDTNEGGDGEVYN